ncbi:DHA2 family efflux MFS transporter permease subunit [Thermocatellispora tengchongensis]
MLALAQGLDVASGAVVNAALPEIGHDFGLGPGALQWALTAYSVAFAGFLLFGGRVADVFGRRLTFALGMGLLAAGSLLACLAPAMAVLVAARALQGVGAALSVPAGLALLTEIFPEGGERDRALAVYASVGACAFAAGLVLGGFLTTWLGWRSVFAVIAVPAALTLAACRMFLPRGRRRAQPLDAPGAAAVTVGLLLGVYGVTRGGEMGWTDPGTLLALALAVGALAAFTWRERRAADPLLPFTLFRSSHVRMGAAGALLFYVAVAGVLFFAPMYLQGMLGYTPLQSGLAVVPMSIVVIATSSVAGRVLVRVGQGRLLVFGLLLIAAGTALWAVTPPDGRYWLHVFPGIAVMSAGQGLAFTALTSASLTGVPQDRHGVAGAVNVTAQQVGSALGVAALAAVAGAVPDTLGGYHAAYLTAAGVVAAGAVALAVTGARTVTRAGGSPGDRPAEPPPARTSRVSAPAE